jgi:hypothetical protein
MLINWTTGSVVGCGTEEECREQLEKCCIIGTAPGPHDRYIIAKVKVLSQMQRVEF